MPAHAARAGQKHVWRAYIAGRSRLGLGRAKAGSGSGEGHNAPLWKVWSLLCPSLRELFTEEPEMLGIAVLCGGLILFCLVPSFVISTLPWYVFTCICIQTSMQWRRSRQPLITSRRL